MAHYPKLAGLVLAVDPRSPAVGFTTKIVPYLVDVWLDDYAKACRHMTDIVETSCRIFLPL